MKPMNNRVIVKPEVAEEQTKRGIIRLDTHEDDIITGKVIKTGTGRTFDNGNIEPSLFAVGDMVLYAKDNGIEFSADDTKYVVLNEADILVKL